jgi:hypothetical protein
MRNPLILFLARIASPVHAMDATKMEAMRGVNVRDALGVIEDFCERNSNG